MDKVSKVYEKTTAGSYIVRLEIGRYKKEIEVFPSHNFGWNRVETAGETYYLDLQEVRDYFRRIEHELTVSQENLLCQTEQIEAILLDMEYKNKDTPE